MSGVPSLGERWAPVEAPLPLLAQAQIHSQRRARLGPEIHGKRKAGGWPCIQMPGSLCSARNSHITEQGRTCQRLPVADLIRIRPVSCASDPGKPCLLPTEDPHREHKSTPLCMSCRLYVWHIDPVLRFICYVWFMCLSSTILPAFFFNLKL